MARTPKQVQDRKAFWQAVKTLEDDTSHLSPADIEHLKRTIQEAGRKAKIPWQEVDEALGIPPPGTLGGRESKE